MFRLPAIGPFDLDQTIAFLEDWPATARLPIDGAVLRFAAVSESDGEPFGVRVHQDGEGVVVQPTRLLDDATRAQVARVLSLDVDGGGFGAVGERDDVVARLQAQRPGLRPVCFWSAWEAAVWAVLTQRASMAQASAIKSRLADSHGTAVEVGGVTLQAFPGPDVVLGLGGVPGIAAVKLRWIHGLARAALDGTLTGEHLRSMPAPDAVAELRRLDGIGPFSAGLIAVRGAGHPDHFMADEPRLLARLRDEYGLTPSADPRPLTEAWRPYRSWVGFLLRATG